MEKAEKLLRDRCDDVPADYQNGEIDLEISEAEKERTEEIGEMSFEEKFGGL